MIGLSRRHLLRLFACAAAGLCTGPATAQAAEETARRIGRRYLARFPEEADAAWLRARLRSAEADFRDGDTVWLDGWLLARSEARWCALSALDR